MTVAPLIAELEFDVWERLEAVTDPELDEPITEMGFVERVTLTGDSRVRIEFRLPTYWCSPNFAFLMAFGIRREVARLPWVKGVEVQLQDHCFGEQVNEGVNSGRAYHEVFAEYCDGADLAEVEAKFLAKAFDRRQESVLSGLLAQGRTPGAITRMRLGELAEVTFGGEEARAQLPRYLSLLAERGLARGPEAPAFVTWEGAPVTEAGFADHVQRLRSTRINMEFNGAMCRGLAATRYKEVEIGPEGPTLVDFIQGRVPPREGAAQRA